VEGAIRRAEGEKKKNNREKGGEKKRLFTHLISRDRAFEKCEEG